MTINFIHNTSRGIKKIKKRTSLFLVSTILVISAFFGGNVLLNNQKHPSSIVSSAPDNTILSVTYLDVGQGNSMIAESDGHYMIMDGGNSDYSSKVVSYLKKIGVKKIDYIIVSHYDADHLSGIIGIINNFDIENIISPDYETDTKIYQSFISNINKKNYHPIHPTIGDEYKIGNAKFKIIAPVSYSYEDENNNSIGIRLADDFHSFLCLGDAEFQSEKDILNVSVDVSCDVYMVSHHGSSNSSKNPLLDKINAKYAVISVGKNDYGHPSSQTIERLSAHNIKIFRTDQAGTIIAYSGKDFLSWSFENPESSSQAGATVYNTQMNYIGNVNSQKFHLPTCTNLPATSNQIYFTSSSEALEAGYSPCSICNPTQ